MPNQSETSFFHLVAVQLAQAIFYAVGSSIFSFLSIYKLKS
nr:MAG TPA: hypothetical protein [Caudoviricetes sp.]